MLGLFCIGVPVHIGKELCHFQFLYDNHAKIVHALKQAFDGTFVHVKLASLCFSIGLPMMKGMQLKPIDSWKNGKQKSTLPLSQERRRLHLLPPWDHYVPPDP